MTTRRGFITGLISLVAAPAIVRADSLMPVKAADITRASLPSPTWRGFNQITRLPAICWRNFETGERVWQ
jgi:hypothetical protein